MITTIIFSKDRPLQLDLCLKSIKKNLVGSDAITVTVIENYSEKYRNSIETLKTEHPEVNFSQQTDKNLFKCTWSILSRENKNPLVCFFTDDGIMFKEQDVGIIERVMQNTNIVTYSIRMGLNVVRREHQGQSAPDQVCKIPQKSRVDLENGVLYWDKTAHFYGNYWSYSHSVDGHAFRYNDIFDWTNSICTLSVHNGLKCQTPNDYEAGLQAVWCSTTQWMSSSLESSYVNSPNNRVSGNFEGNSSGDTYYCSPDEMLRLYEQGKRIDFLKIPIGHIDCPHTEIDIMKGIQ